MKILHTSDWHLGKTLYGRRCHNEFEDFLNWLIDEVERQKTDCLLVAGDIFDNTTPPNSILSLYYSFLHNISKTCCRHVVIIGGNHDSPSLLNAPRKLLEHLNITVVGSITGDPADEVVPLRDQDGVIEMIVCAVPYLRDRDVRRAEAGESIDEKAHKLVQGIAAHYASVLDIAKSIRDESGENIPIVAMGHLFTVGGKVADNDEVRDLYVGTLAHVHASTFPDCIDYLALGHLHIAQMVDNCETMRYSGSPLQLSFTKRNERKSITSITFSEKIKINHIKVPSFLKLHSINGNLDELFIRIDEFIATGKKILLEVIYNGKTTGTLHQDLADKVSGTDIEILRIMNQHFLLNNLNHHNDILSLDNLSEIEVFRKCLEYHNVSDEEQVEMELCYREILDILGEEDGQ